MSRHVRRARRAPFVVTALAGLAATGCHSTDVEVDADVENGRGDPDGDRVDETADAALETALDMSDADARVEPAECPAENPGFGARKRCAAAASVRCAYVDGCPSHPAASTTDVYACHDDGTGARWTLVSDPYVPSCPKLQPNDGDPCPCSVHMAYLACNYGACESPALIYAACKGVDTFDRVWHVGAIPCNPPEIDSGGRDALTDVADGDSR